MSPGTDAVPLPEALPAELVAEGAAYGVALLERIAAGASSPGDFVALVLFLQGHPMLYGFAGVILDALRRSLAAPQGVRH